MPGPVEEFVVELASNVHAAAAARVAGLPLGVVTGEVDDTWTAGVQRDMADRLGATWIELPGIGHNPGVEDPQLTASALDRIFGSVPIPMPDQV